MTVPEVDSDTGVFLTNRGGRVGVDLNDDDVDFNVHAVFN